MKDLSSKNDLFEYYNERAPEYEAFYRGEFPSGTPDPDLYRNDTAAISKLLPDFLSGDCIDIACGTGFWLPVYEKNCPNITLIDQSEDALAECSKKIHMLGIENKIIIIRDDIFDYTFKPYIFDKALAGFLISHFNEVKLKRFLLLLKHLLKDNGKFVIIDSIWSEDTSPIHGTKEGLVKRSLFDGRKFQIFKRCFEKRDLETISQTYKLNLEIIYWGKVFFLATGGFGQGK